MSTAVMVVVAVVIVVALAAALLPALRQGRTRRLRRRFGPEYDRAVEREGGRAAAERELMSREKRHEELPLHDLDPRQRELYREQWTHVQEQFVDAPGAAVSQADRLVTAVMAERGYPTRDFEDRAAHLSVEHGRTLDHYRRGHDIGVRAERDGVSTEDLRQAMVHYRALFEDLLAVPEGERSAEAAANPAQSADSADSADSAAEPAKSPAEAAAETRVDGRADEPVAGRRDDGPEQRS
ncbi:hypothetical protein [Actinomadura rupiterrae]|uniref:hypothetical protein n=1 Tax=Actinomadura rupiterrae TaxID=559627 RepID=UPI0020A24C34|nr:hypothetical protein [Actinomadura rupiterrae]MCP2342357.1 hypothetical protein [Actinomadura rupiterrae]